MTDKERLEDIDKRAKHRVLENIRGEVRYRFTEINTEDYDWLIKQAERAKRYKQALEYIQREIRRAIYTSKKQKWNSDFEREFESGKTRGLIQASDIVKEAIEILEGEE